ncbi:phosphate acyltransferase PlsX [Tuanshanicoccus lijuaniae]|uniref:phosphate acyltransferase PlsX n=1 Tax=Aerococcaceae bacterium zg-1292 TaxID=2774330 RepID=UPI0019373813|nr:phosphate acyltransferase PlsX [Aerococcaceae bacterium zg-1292]MBS4456803.1 phosphate acyltransferase PlsX [Aerococcaceae bacterium zg-A91]MBS4458631.1 phosphate acyltransferase PlsX [Aerococcaceae bacterium zg-BR33]QQA37428.1 phosphate acyltransferase PlsX [Aerococcaceae bacterium zg-1292]
MFRIAVDAMGGDNAPKAIVEGVNQAVKQFPDIEIVLVGDEAQITPLLETNERITIVHTSEKVESDDEPVSAVRRKKQSSMVMAAQMVKDNEADVLLSAGNTGALLASGLLVIGRIKGVDRPGLMPILPTMNEESPQLILMDAGANADCKPKNLHQFAILANFYAKSVLGITTPRVGLINNGTEASKGNELTKASYELLRDEAAIHFIGNVEAKELLRGVCDIAVTDGFTGNAILKSLEGTSKTLFSAIKHKLLTSGVKGKLGALLIKDALLSLREQYDDSKQGGAILLGVKAPVIKAHGSSNDEAIFHAIRQARLVLEAKVVNQMEEYFARN